MNRRPENVLDECLVCASQAGSADAFSELVRRWTHRLLRFAAGSLGSTEGASDVVQETWTAAIRGLRRLQDPAIFPAWLFRIAARRCADAIRRNMRSRRISSGVRQQAEVATQTVEAGVPSPHALDVAAALRALSTEHREAIHLFYGADLGVEDIAAVLGVPAGTVKSRLHHAREFLRRRMGADYERAR